MSQNSIFLPVVANGFLFYLPYIKWNLKKKKLPKKSGNLSIVSNSERHT